MLIFNEDGTPVTLDDLTAPVDVEYYWTLDFNIQEFTLSPLIVLEEMTGAALEIDINGFRFWLPTTWNVLIMDPETSQLDVIELSELTSGDFDLFTFGLNAPLVTGKKARVINYTPSMPIVGPALNKHQMLCHPISTDEWINIAPTDVFNKHVKGLVLGDII